MTTTTRVAALFLASGAFAVAACSPSEKTTETAATTGTAVVDSGTVPSALQGIAGLDQVPAPLLPQIAAETLPHWARCGDTMVAKVVGATGQDEGFIVARDLAVKLVETPIDVPSQQQGVTKRLGINLTSGRYAQYYGEGVARTDIDGRRIVRAGWDTEKPLAAPLPYWRADDVGGTWRAEFRRGATDADTWGQRYVAANCADVPQTG